MITYPNLGQCGRLGNQLFQVASTMGLAFDRNELPCFPKWDYERYFNVPAHYFTNEVRGESTPATDLVPHMSEQGKPYLQDFNLFAKIEDVVRGYFQPSTMAAKVLKDQAWIDELPKPLTSVHVRRGDNVTHPQGYHPLRSNDYYRAAMEFMPKDGSVVVFSDDYDWCRQNMEQILERSCTFFQGTPRAREYDQRVQYEMGPVLDWIDVCLMAKCDSHILSNSTYAWWGAFLSQDKSPIYPAHWFGRLLTHLDASLMFPPNWRQVADQTQGGI